MYRLNVKVTEEATAIIKAEAKRLGCGMGTIITIWALEKKKEFDVLTTMQMYKQQMNEQENK